MKFWECLPLWVQKCVKGKSVREIRLRNNALVRVNIDGQWWYCSEVGLSRNISQCKILDVPCDSIVSSACNNSIYAYEQMLAEGYFTLADGARFGVAGSYSSSGQVFKEYTSVCIRVPHCIDCAKKEMLTTVKDGNTLIVGAPASGKTTLLRDIARRLSEGENIAVVDERGELDVGGVLVNCDVIKWTSKSSGVEMALRSLSPSYLMCDELSQADFSWVARATGAGVKVVATLHGSSLDDVKRSCDCLCHFKNMIVCKSVGQYEIVSLV